MKYYGDSVRPETIAYADENARHAENSFGVHEVVDVNKEPPVYK